MPITSSIPVLQGSGGAVLSAEPDGLLLDRPGQKATIPVRAVARVHAESRSVTVELRALPGATPSVHLIEGVSEAAGAAFAEAVNALLPAPAEDVDGAALVDLRTFTKTWLEGYRRRLGRVVLGYLGAILALALVTAIAGPGETGVAGAVFIVPLGLLAAVMLWLGGVCVVPWFHETRLRRHGVTVDAEPADDPGTYRYTDTTGTTHVFAHQSTAPSVRVAYPPRDPSSVLVLQARNDRILEIVLGPGFIFSGLVVTAFPIWLATSVLQGKQLP
ncbi:hypothetical protein ACIQUQ_13535 [Streptomyces sp. NPDC101118]|uniref:hypothetical protein n=1 Tax=Streptomyces sp. NPDC101118 TaxID=3366109 RepID=UPI00381DE048